MVCTSEVSLRRNPSLSASRMQTMDTSGRSRPSRRGSRPPGHRRRLASSRDGHGLDGIQLGVQPLAAQTLLLEEMRQVFGQPLGERGDADALPPRSARLRTSPSSAGTCPAAGSMRTPGSISPVGRITCSTTSPPDMPIS